MGDGRIRTIGRYEVEREIGRGGMAVVYKAFDPRLERAVAIKLIQSGAFGSNIFGHIRERFEREAKALAKLDHPNIVKVLDYGEHEGAPYLVMDYLEGATLKEVRKPLRVETAVRLLRPIAEALDYVHRHGLLHRDVKPSNIMITKEERVVLTDFGIAKWIEDEGELFTLTGTGVGIGTPEYMAPEQGRGKQLDGRSDAYSLTIVFYELITGKKPYGGDTPLDVLMNQVSEPIPDPRELVPELNESVKRFLDRALAKKPEDRYPTMRDYLRDFDGLRLQALAGRGAKPSGTMGTGEIRTELRSEAGTDSSVRFGRTDLQKVHEAGSGGQTGDQFVQPVRPVQAAPQAAQQPLQAARQAAGQAVNQRAPKRRGWLIGALAAIAVVAGAIGIRTVQPNRGLSAIGTSEAALTQAAGLQTEIADQRAAVAATGQANAEAVQRREEESAATLAMQQTAVAGTAAAKARNPYADVKVGDIIEFGSYEQDNTEANGAEPIEWRVLEVSGGSALAVSEYALDARAYNEDYESVTWAECTLREWLNGEFYATAFNEAEKGLVALMKVKNADNPEYGTDGGVDTEDRIFLLSLGEAERYFEDDEDRRTIPTEYAVAKNVYVSSDLGTVWWWLRSPGYTSNKAAVVLTVGSLDYYGLHVNDIRYAVRPALRIWLDWDLATMANAEPVQRREEESAATLAMQAEIAIQQTAAAVTATAEARNPYANVKTGNQIKFGRYEQDNDFANGAEPIEWRVLEVSGGSALAVSEYALDARAYNEDYESVTWAECTLREWLNGEFYETAFNEDEKRRIALTKVENADNPTYGTDGGVDTEDRIFLLSLGEAGRYFEDDEDRRTIPTEYAVAKNVYVSSDLGTVWWWLRSPGLISISAAEVLIDGSLRHIGGIVDYYGNAVRPALRLKMTP